LFAAVVDEAGRAAPASGSAPIIRGAREPCSVDLLGMSGERHPASGEFEHGEPFPRVGNADVSFRGRRQRSSRSDNACGDLRC
jgi:hypothetical protein